jgi:hypothetical protein
MMTRQRGFYNKKTGKVVWVDLEKIQDFCIEKRNNPVAPAVIGDAMDPLKTPNGVWCDSKAIYDRTVESEGYRIQGDNEKAQGGGWEAETTEKWLNDVEADVEQATHRAINDLRYDAHEFSEDSRAQADDINSKFKAVTGKEPTVKGGLN